MLFFIIGFLYYFIVECVEKDMVVLFYYIYFIVGFVDSELVFFMVSFVMFVDGN